MSIQVLRCNATIRMVILDKYALYVMISVPHYDERPKKQHSSN